MGLSRDGLTAVGHIIGEVEGLLLDYYIFFVLIIQNNRTQKINFMPGYCIRSNKMFNFIHLNPLKIKSFFFQ